MRWIIPIAIGVSAVAMPAAALSQNHSELAAARSAGQVGERYDGYLGSRRRRRPRCKGK